MSTRRTTGLMAGLLLLAPLASLAAAEPTTGNAQPQAEATAPAPNDADLSALKVGKDPKTGELRKTTPAEDAELTRQMREFWAQFPRHSAKTDRKSGLTSLVVAPHSISTSVATIGADGKLVWGCVDHPEHAEATLEQLRAQAAQPAPEDR